MTSVRVNDDWDSMQFIGKKQLISFYNLNYLPNLFTNGPTMRDPKNPPSGNMDTVTDHRRVRRLSNIGP